MYAAWRGFEAVVAALLQHPATHVNLQVRRILNIHRMAFFTSQKKKEVVRRVD